ANPKTILFMLSSRCRDAALVGPVFELAGVPSAEPDIAPSVQRRHSRSKQVEAIAMRRSDSLSRLRRRVGEGAEAVPPALHPTPFGRSSVGDAPGDETPFPVPRMPAMV